MKNKIAFLHWGNGSQIRSFYDFAFYLDEMLYLRDLKNNDFLKYAAIVVPDGMDCDVIRPFASSLNDYIRNGGFLIIFGGEYVAEIIDVVDIKWRNVRIQDWLWWTKPNPKIEIYQPEPFHPLCEYIPLKDMSWHWIGVFDLHKDAESILSLNDDSASLFLDFKNLEGGGRLMLSTLDPHVHNGERFMPATTRFLKSFYPWLRREVGIQSLAQSFVFTYLQCLHHPSEWQPEGLSEIITQIGGVTHFLPLYDLKDDMLDETDILYIPNNQDQLFLREKQSILLQFLERGGHLIINSEPAISWLPFLSAFQAVPSRPFKNLKVRVNNDPYGFFANMDYNFDGWEGIFGQYARGWTEPPHSALCLTEVGSEKLPKPADWLWQYPTKYNTGGYVFMHNGDNLIRYPDHGPNKNALVRDICAGLIKLQRCI